MKWKIQIKNPSHEYFNKMIVMDFLMVEIGPYFQKSIEGAIFSIFKNTFYKHIILQTLGGVILIWTFLPLI